MYTHSKNIHDNTVISYFVDFENENITLNTIDLFDNHIKTLGFQS